MIVRIARIQLLKTGKVQEEVCRRNDFYSSDPHNKRVEIRYNVQESNQINDTRNQKEPGKCGGANTLKNLGALPIMHQYAVSALFSFIIGL